MGWQDDLQNLLGQTKDEMWQGLYTSDSLPLNELATGDWGGAATSVPSAAFNLMDVPLSAVKSVAGYGLAAPDLFKDALGFEDAGTRATLARLNSQGDSGRANWEHFIADKPMPVQAALEIGLDPTTYLSLGLAPAAKSAVKGLKAGAELGTLEKGLIRGLDAADFVWNTGPDKVVRSGLSAASKLPGVQGAGQLAKSGLGKVVNNPFGLTAASLARRGYQQAESAADEWLQSIGRGLPNKSLAIIPPRNAEKAVAPFESYDVPPFAKQGATTLSTKLQTDAYDAWVRLKSAQMTTPAPMPGINQPGMGEVAPWRASLKKAAEALRQQGDAANPPGTFRNPGQRPTVRNAGDIKNALSGWYQRQQQLGFIAPPPGGYQHVGEVQLDEDNIRDMAKIAVASMMAYNDEAQSRLFPALRRASEGMRGVQRDVITGLGRDYAYGPGVQPYLPAVWDEARPVLEEAGISPPQSRFITPWGLPEGTVDDTRLNAIEQRLKDGKITREQALREAALIKSSKGSPQVVETAAAQGAAAIQSFQYQQTNDEARGMFDAFSGTMRPTAENPETKRAAVPEGFPQFLEQNAELENTYLGTFEDNKDVFDSYVQSLYGQMDQDELEVLREYAIEILYDEAVNAASVVSGGQGGATTFLKRGAAKIDPKTGRATNYKGDSHQKISVFGDNPSDIGYMYRDADGNMRGNYQDLPGEAGNTPYGRVSFSSANKIKFKEQYGEDLTTATYRKLVGNPKAKFTGSSEQYVEALEAIGSSGFRENPTGGALANIYRIVDMYKAGREIPVGATIAEDWYSAAAKEAMGIVGPGNYEDAMMLMELTAITSSGTDVERNAQNAMRAFAEWKLGSDKFIRENLGLSDEQVNSLLNGTVTRGKKKSQTGWTDHLNMFRNGMQYSQKGTTTDAFAVYANKAMSEGWTPVQGGPKTNNFAGSFVIKLWQDAVNEGIADSSLREKVRGALDNAAKIWTEDRHQSRISNLATAVSPMEAVFNRERGIMASDLVPVRSEDMQVAIWYYSKDRQGFRRVARNDDMAVALRQVWNDEADPSRLASVREMARREIGPDATEDEIQNFAYDLMYQEVQVAMVSKVLKENKKQVEKTLGKGNPLEKFWELQNDQLGIVSRNMRGVTARKSPANSIVQLTGQIEQHLQDLRNGGWGTTLGWDGNNFVPETPASGYAVALTSAGKTGQVDNFKPKTATKAINQFLVKYADLLDDPTTGGHIKFGFFPMDGNKSSSFDLTIIVPDEQTAIDLARRANQKAIYDIASEDLIDTGGDGTPVLTSAKDVRDVIYSIFGRGDNSHVNAANNAAAIDEFSNDPLSIFQRRVVTPVMEEFQHLSERVATGNERLADASRLQTPGGGVLVNTPTDTNPLDFASMGQDYGISTQGNSVLSQDLNGRRVGDWVQKWYQEGQDDIQTLLNSGVSWDPAATFEDRMAAAAGNDTVQQIVKKYQKEGIDPLFAGPRDLMMKRLERAYQKKEGVKFERDSLWDLFVAAWGEQALFSPKYHLGNLQGAFLQNAFSGHLGADSPSAFLASWKITRGGLEAVEKAEALQNLKSYQIATKWGFEELPSYISRGGVRGMTSETRVSGSAVGELTARLTKSERLGRNVGKPFEANADLSQALETVIRGSLWAEFLDDEMTRRMSVVEDSINAMAVSQGLSGFEFSILNNINLPQTGERLIMTPKLMKEHLMSLGFNDGYAERAARNYAEARNQAKNVAKSAVDKYQFSYDRTNLDEAIAKFAPFMYWLSRATRFYGEELLRHPAVALNYARANKRIDEAQDDPGLSARQKGFLRLMGGPTGFSILMNPEALFGVVKIFGLDDSYQPDGQTEMGGVISWAKARGLGLYPWIDGSLNLMGVYGDTFEPDMLGIRHKALIGSVVNFMRSHLGMEPVGSPYQDAMSQARWGVSTFISQFTPDWMTQPVAPKAGGNTTDATMDQIIESRVIANNPGLSNAQLLDIMTDDQHPEFIKAYQQASDANLLQNLINFTAPQNYRVREDSRDVRTAQVSTIYEAAQKSGQDPWNFRPQVGDVEFATTYENLTGKRWQPGDYQTAKEKNDLMRATPEHKMYVLQEQEYNNLGGEKNMAIMSRYRDILYGNDPRTAALDEESRREVANQWADANGVVDNINYVYQLQDAYERSHPEYGQFKGWQDQMRNLQTSLGGSLDEYRRQAIRQNPNAANYFQRMIAGIKEDYPQDQWQAEIDRQTTNMNAYLSITGVPQNRFDQGPVPFAPNTDVTLATNTPPQSYGNIPDAMKNLLQGNSGYGLNTFGASWNQ